MKKKFRKIAASALAVTLAAANVVMPQSPISDIVTEISASAASESGTYSYGGVTYSYAIENGYAKLNSVVKSSSSSWVIPSRVLHDGNYYTVTTLSNDFAMGSNARTITVPSTVKSIGNNFAQGCLAETVNLSSNVVEIGHNFCADSKNLRNVYYSGTKLVSLGQNPLKNTPFISIKNSKGAVTMGQWLIKYLGTASTIDVLALNSNNPDITKIAEEAFINNKSVRRVNLNGVYIVGKKAFYNCTNLATVSNAYALNDVGGGAFDETKWKTNNKNANGHNILGRTLISYKSTGSSTIDLTVSDFNNVSYIAEGALSDAAVNATTLKLPNSITSIDDYALNGNYSMSSIANIYLYDTKITYSNFSQFSGIMENTFAAFANTAWGASMAKSKGKEILSSLGLTYVGTGDKGRYSAYKEYQIAQKLYDYIGQTYKYKYYIDGGSRNYIEEMFYKKGIVCADYADLYMYLLELAGVNAEVVWTDNYVHAWNVIEIGVDWYHADVCWYNPQTMFMLNDNQIAEETSSHTSYHLVSYLELPAEMYTLTDVPWCYYQMGDVTRDGKVDAADVTLHTNYILGKTSLSSNALYLADLDRDGVINVFDNILIKEMIQ